MTMHETSIKPPKDRTWRASGLVNTGRFGEHGVAGEGAWSVPGTGEPGGLQSMGLRRVGHN